MARDGVKKKTRVLFARGHQRDGVSLLAALSKASEFDVSEFSGSPDDIFQQAVAKSVDLLIMFLPEVTEEYEKCVRRVLLGTFSHILMLVNGDVSDEIVSNAERVTVYRVSNFELGTDSVVTQAVSLGGIRHRRSATISSAMCAGQTAGGSFDASNRSARSDGALSSKLVAIGASTGGTEAIVALLGGLRPHMPGIVIVQHMPPVFTEMFAERLNRDLPFEVCEAKNNTPIRQGSIHIAPGDRHLSIKKITGGYATILGDVERIGGYCPSVDVLFESVAKVAGAAATGVILTGMGGDGATGMLEMRKRGAYTIGQDEKSCVVYGMPRRAFELGAVVRQAPLSDIAGLIMAHLGAE